MGCAWSKPPSAWCLSSWSTAACRITFEVSGVSLLRRPCWACAWMCVRAWPTWKKLVSSTETWYEQAQGLTPASTGPKTIPLKCSSAKSERASLSSAPHMAFPPPPAFSCSTHFRRSLVGKCFKSAQIGTAPGYSSNTCPRSFNPHSSNHWLWNLQPLLIAFSVPQFPPVKMKAVGKDSLTL